VQPSLGFGSDFWLDDHLSHSLVYNILASVDQRARHLSVPTVFLSRRLDCWVAGRCWCSFPHLLSVDFKKAARP
jgi:hypothetical protein